MSYTLELTLTEREAIDWVGHRYAHGDQLRNLLDAALAYNPAYNEDDHDLWAQPEPLTFTVPEHVAWEIRELLCDREGRFPGECFAPSLTQKIQAFCDAII